MENKMLRYRFIFQDYSGYGSNNRMATEKEISAQTFVGCYCFENIPEVFQLLRSVNGMKSSYIIEGDQEEESKTLFLLDDLTYTVRTRGFVGVIKVIGQIPLENDDDKLTDVEVYIEIGSRFDRLQGNQYFLTYMMAKTLDDAPQFMKEAIEVGSSAMWELLLLYIYKKKLEEAARQGIYKAYRQMEYNDSKLKGAIDIPRHFRDNIPFIGNIAYGTREHTHDNPLLYLILFAFDKLKMKYPNIMPSLFPPGSPAYKAIVQMRELTPGYMSANVRKVLEQCRKRVSHPFYSKYEDLRLISIRVLRGAGISIYDSGNEDIKGLLLYVPGLWEDMLQRSITVGKAEPQHIVDILFPLGSQEKQNKGSEVVRPDFIINHKFVLDAKYKPKWSGYINGRVSFENVKDDYLQVSHYMYILEMKAGGVAFPMKKSPIQNKYFQQSMKCKSQFYALGIPVPEAENENQWIQEFEKNLQQFNEKLREALSSPEA